LRGDYLKRKCPTPSDLPNVSDSSFLSIMPHVVRHFVQTEIRHFGGSENQQALAWLTGNSEAGAAPRVRSNDAGRLLDRRRGEVMLASVRDVLPAQEN